MIDHFHLEHYGEQVVNYNRDLDIFPVLKEILHRITGRDIYYSPTDMGVNVIGECITDDKAIRRAAKDEIIRRYYRALADFKKGLVGPEVPERIKLLMNKLSITEDERTVVAHAFDKLKSSGCPSACIKVGKRYITGRRTDYLSPVSSTILNALKTITRIPDSVDLIAPTVLTPILDIKNRISNFKANYLDLSEVLIALSICSTTNPVAKKALETLPKLADTELHSTHMLSDNEMVTLANLGINATYTPDLDID